MSSTLVDPNYDLLPKNLRAGMNVWVDHGILPGHFLTTVIHNDLKETFARADALNRERIFDIVSFFYNEVPWACWGTKEKVQEWINHSGMEKWEV